MVTFFLVVQAYDVASSERHREFDGCCFGSLEIIFNLDRQRH